MKMYKHDGLDLKGILIIYVVTILYVFSLIYSFVNRGTFRMGEFFVLLVFSLSLILTVLYHLNIIKNYLVIGIFGIFTGAIIGGVFILIDGKSYE